MTTSIRRAKRTEGPGIAGLNEVVQSLHFEQRPDWFKPPDADAFLPIVERWLSSDDVAVVVADRERDGLVGYGVGIRHDRRDNPLVRGASMVELDQIVVVERWRGKGIGRLLANAVIDWARAEGVDRVELSTWVFNGPAQTMFEGLGFQPTSIRMAMPLTSSKSPVLDT